MDFALAITLQKKRKSLDPRLRGVVNNRMVGHDDLNNSEQCSFIENRS